MPKKTPLLVTSTTQPLRIMISERSQQSPTGRHFSLKKGKNLHGPLLLKRQFLYHREGLDTRGKYLPVLATSMGKADTPQK
jgi:hypothetical protein